MHNLCIVKLDIKRSIIIKKFVTEVIEGWEETESKVCLSEGESGNILTQ